MAEASPSLPTPEVASNSAIAYMVAEIRALIDSKPTGPSDAELTAVLKNVLAPAMPREGQEFTELAAEYERMLNDVGDDARVDADAALDAFDSRLSECARRILSKPAHTVGDLLVRASIVAYYARGDLGYLEQEASTAALLVEDLAAEELAIGVLRIFGGR
jgi:hypothetical protein